METWGSRTAKVRLFFGEGDFDFALLVDQLQELQDITGAGPGALLERIRSGNSSTWLQDLKHTIRLGLVGARMEREPAARLVDRSVKSGYLQHCALVAAAILGAAYVGVEEEPLGERKGRGSHPSRMGASDGPKSSAPPRPRASRRRKPASAPSGN